MFSRAVQVTIHWVCESLKRVLDLAAWGVGVLFVLFIPLSLIVVMMSYRISSISELHKGMQFAIFALIIAMIAFLKRFHSTSNYCFFNCINRWLYLAILG